MAKLNPYLNFAGNTEEAFTFYRSVFGGEFVSVVRFKDMPMEGVEIPEADLDKIMHIGLPVGPDAVLMASDVLPALGQSLQLGNHNYISVTVDSRDEADRVFKGLSDGGEVEMAIADMPWGDYWGSFKDRYGVLWMVSYTPPQEQ